MFVEFFRCSSIQSQSPYLNRQLFFPFFFYFSALCEKKEVCFKFMSFGAVDIPPLRAKNQNDLNRSPFLLCALRWIRKIKLRQTTLRDSFNLNFYWICFVWKLGVSMSEKMTHRKFVCDERFEWSFKTKWI